MKNTSQTETINTFDALLKFSDSVSPQQIELNFPLLSPGETVNFNDIIFVTSL